MERCIDDAYSPASQTTLMEQDNVEYEAPEQEDGPSSSQIAAKGNSTFDANNYPLPPRPPNQTMAQIVARNIQREGQENWAESFKGKHKGKGRSHPPILTTTKPGNTTLPDDRPPRVINDTQVWTLRFADPPPPEDRLSDQAMFWITNSINKERWTFDTLVVRWTPGNNISLRFSAQTSEASVEAHQMEFIRRLGHNRRGVTLTRSFKWSKITIKDVPCFLDRDEDGVETFVDIDDIITQLGDNPLYNRLSITQQP